MLARKMDEFARNQRHIFGLAFGMPKWFRLDLREPKSMVLNFFSPLDLLANASVIIVYIVSGLHKLKLKVATYRKTKCQGLSERGQRQKKNSSSSFSS